MKVARLRRQLPPILSIFVAIVFTCSLVRPRQAHGEQNTVVTVSAASYAAELSPGGIAAGFGTNLATGLEVAATKPLPTSLAGTTVKVNGQLAPLFFVSPGQINYLIPPDSPSGNLPVIVTSGDGTVLTGTVQVNDVAPAIFTASATGEGLSAALILRVLGTGAQVYEPVGVFDPAQNRIVARPIDPGPAGDRIFLVLYLCGVRKAAPGATRVVISGNELDPAFVGESPDFIGLDQINVELPRYLGGRGRVTLRVKTVDRISNLTEIEMGGSDIRSATTTTVTSSAMTAVAGQSINFTVQVVASAQGAGIPVGNVVLLDNGTIIGMRALDAAGQAVFGYVFDATGSHAMTAEFEGRTNFKNSTGTLAAAQVVNKAQSTIALTSSNNPANRDQVVELTAELQAVAPSTFMPTGVVQFKADNAPIGAPITLINGLVSLEVSALAIGTRVITAAYYGDPSFNPSASIAFQQIIIEQSLQVGGIVRPSPVYASDGITINGSGFTTKPSDHEVQVTDDSGAKTTAQVTVATASQLKARVPFGAGSGRVKVIVRGVEGESPDRLELGTSVSGFVQAFKDGNRTPVPGLPVSLIEPNGRRIDALTNTDGSFVLKAATPFQSPVFSRISIAAQALNGINYPAQTRNMTPAAGRDNQYRGEGVLANIIELKQNGGASTSGIVEGAPANQSLKVAAPANRKDIEEVITSGQVTFDTNNSTITFPGGVTGSLTLTVLDSGRTPSNLPALQSGSYFSSTIAQITPFGATLVPGGKLTFPNSDEIPIGTPVRAFRFDQTANSPTLGRFIDIGAATISADGTQIETAANAVTQTSYYFVSRLWPTVTIIGNVLDETDGRALRRAVVNARGQSAFTDNSGGFVLPNVPVITPDGTNDQVTIEISFVRADGSIARSERIITGLKAGESRQLTEDFVLPRAGTNRAPQIYAPSSVIVYEGESRDFNFIVSDPDGNPVNVSMGDTTFATLVTAGVDTYALRLAPGTNVAGNHTLTITASDVPANGPSLPTEQVVRVIVQSRASRRPTADYLSATATEDTPVNLTLTALNPSGGMLNYTTISNPAHGLLSGIAPNLTYTPAANFNGFDSFSFKVSGIGGESNVAAVFIAVKPVNDAPSLTVTGATGINAGQTVTLTLNATDVDAGQALSFAAVELPPGAALIVTSATSAQLVWTPIFTQNGSYPITFTVSDDGAPPMSSARAATILVDAKWAETSGPEGGTINALLYDGANLFAGTEGGEIYRSGDLGQSWAAVSTGLSVRFQVLALIGSGANLFAGTQGGGVYRSTNQARSWSSAGGLTGRFVRSFALNGTTLLAGTDAGVFRSTNQGVSYVPSSSGLTSGTVSSLAVIGTTLFAGIGGVGLTAGGVFRSSDGGATWSPINTGLSNLNVLSLRVVGTTLFAGTFGGGVFVFNGLSWSPSNTGLSSLNVRALGLSGTILYAGTDVGVFRSTNNGQNWSALNAGLTNPGVISFAASSDHVFAGTFGGVFRLPNLSLSWTQMNSGLTSPQVFALAASGNTLFAGANGGGIAVSVNNGASWTPTNNGLANQFVRSLVVAGANVFAGTGGGGVFRSSNNGASWTAVNTGLANPAVLGLAASGTDLLAGTFGGGVFRSTNQGQNWTAINTGLTTPRVLAVGISGAVYLAGTLDGGVFRSTNQGQNWAPANSGLTGVTVASFAASGASIFAATSDGVFRSADQGQTWTAASAGLGNVNVFSVLANGATLFAATTSGVFRSADQGQSWRALNTGLAGAYALSLAAIGTNIFAGAPGGVFLLTNNVQSWTAANSGLSTSFVNALLVNGARLLTGTQGAGVFRSDNEGQSWTATTGLPAGTNVQALTVASTSLFAGLFGQGVYRSTTNGNTWTAFNDAGLTNLNVNALAAGSGFLFAATDDGIFRTPTGAASWTKLSAGLTTVRVLSLRVLSGNLYAGSDGGGVFVIPLNGATWTERNGNGPGALGDLNITALGADGTALLAGTDGGGIYRSTNGGTSWAAINTGLPPELNVYAFAASDGLLYAGSIYGVFLSEDNGANWKQLNAGLFDTYVTSLAVSGKTLIAGTRVGGVFTSQIP